MPRYCAYAVVLQFYKYFPFKAKNEDEKQMIALLQTHNYARNSGDLKSLQSLYHENAVYITGDGIKSPKPEIVNAAPNNWLDANKVKLLNPEIKTNGDEVEIIVKVKAGAHYTTSKIFFLAKENDKWLIIRVKSLVRAALKAPILT